MSEIAGLPTLAQAAAEATQTASSELDRDAFLSLLTTQLQNQDPLEPMNNEEFVAQLATFSSLEQLMTIGDGMEALYLGIASMNNAAMASLVGTDVVASGNGVVVEDGQPVELHYDAAEGAPNATVTILDDEGNVVTSFEVKVHEGEGSVTWDATNLDGQGVEDGDYTFTISATDADGNDIAIDELVVGTITEMDYSTGVPLPSIDGVLIELGDIIRLTVPDDEGAEDAA